MHRVTNHSEQEHTQLPRTIVRPLSEIIEVVQKFEPEHSFKDRDWQFYLRLGRTWHSLQVKLYENTWYFTLQKDSEYERPQSFHYNPETTEHQGLDDIEETTLANLQRELTRVYAEVKNDAAAYHGELASTLSPTLQYGVIHRSIVNQLLPGWSHFDNDLTADERARSIKLLAGFDPPPLPRMTAGIFFDYVKTAYLANPGTFARYESPCDPTLSGRDLYCRWADGRDGGLRDVELNSEEAFGNWFDGKSWRGGHPFEIFRGGNSTHINLNVWRAENTQQPGWKIALHAFSSTRLAETCRAALAFQDRELPCEMSDRKSYLLRLQNEDYVGIIPHGRDRSYGWHSFPKEFNVADSISFSQFRDDENGKQIRPWREIRKLVTWLPLRPLRVEGC